MDQTQLQQKIAEYFQKLPKESQEVFSSMVWMETLKNIGVKYSLNEKQMETLGTETTLLLLSIIHIDEYREAIKTELGLTEEITDKIFAEINENILKTIKDQLTETFEANAILLSKENTDPNFSGLPQNIQESIKNSNWKEKLYEVARKYKLTISQMGTLEEITVKVMKNDIHSDKYEEELTSKITIPKEDTHNLVNDVNEQILKSIRGLLMNPNKNEENIPLPPYAKVEEKKVEDLEIPRPPKPVETAVKSNIVAPIINEPKNIIEEKLKGATISEHKVSDYSVPKEINIPSFPTEGGDKEDSPKKYDPYREVI